jgi:hypothetical protein
MSTATTPAPVATEEQDGAYARALFLATFPAGYVPKTDTRTPAQVKADRASRP